MAVGMKPLSERDENSEFGYKQYMGHGPRRNEATL